MTLDWQFVVVTAVALGAAGVIVRRFVPSRRRTTGSGGPAATPVACEHCETGAKTAQTAAPTGSARTRTTPVVTVDDLRRSAKRH